MSPPISAVTDQKELCDKIQRARTSGENDAGQPSALHREPKCEERSSEHDHPPTARPQRPTRVSASTS